MRNYLSKMKKTAPEPSKQTGNAPNPYIVEQLNNNPKLNINMPKSDEQCASLESLAIICRFNCFWPKPVELFHWILANWSLECDIHLCSKGFFVVKFPSPEARDKILHEGPWFWGSTSLFTTP